MKEYEDIINLPRHISKKRVPMDRINRAAQFAPFSALKGYDASIKETARLTQEKIELDEYDKYFINEKLILLKDNIKQELEITITYFKKDKTKKGGRYIRYIGVLKDIDEYNFSVKMKDGLNIDVKDIVEIESNLFDNINNMY